MKKADKIEVEGMRAIGKCNIRAKVVTIPVKFYSGTEERESTHLSRVCPDCKGEVGNKFGCKSCNKELQYGEIKNGYRVGKDVVEIEDYELDYLRGDIPDVIDGIKTFPKNAINSMYFLKPYFLCPQDSSSVIPFEIFRKGLEETQRAMLCKIAVRSDVRYAVIYEEKGRLVAHTLRYNTEIRDIERVPKEDNVDRASVTMMSKLFDSMNGKLADGDLKDEREEKFKEFIEKKMKGESVNIEKPSIEIPSQSFAEQLRASLEVM